MLAHIAQAKFYRVLAVWQLGEAHKARAAARALAAPCLRRLAE